MVNMATVNVNSITNKIPYITHMIDLNNIKILGVTETWLTPDVPSSFVDIPQFSTVRADSPSGRRKHGCLVYVHRSLKYVVVQVAVPNIVVIQLMQLDVYYMVCYRPPSYSDMENARTISFLEDFCPGKEIIIMGDFNLPSLNWQDGVPGYVPGVDIGPLDRQFLDMFLSLGLTQWVAETTFVPSGSIIDLMLTSEEDRVGTVRLLPPFPQCGHCAVVAEYVFNLNQVRESHATPRRSWHRGRYNDIACAVNNVDWGFEFQDTTVEEDFTLLLSVLRRLINRYVPMSRPQLSPPWSVKPPRQLIVQRGDAWNDYKATRALNGRNHVRSLEALHRYQQLNVVYRTYATTMRAQYESSLLFRNDNRKLLHAYVRNKKVGCPTVGPLKLPDGRVVVEERSMCNLLAVSFSGVFVARAPHNPQPFQQFDGRISEVAFSRDVVEGVLLSLDPTSSSGPDEIHPRLLRECARALSTPLCLIFQKSFTVGRVPSAWSSSNIVPIYKSKAHSDPLNYRPISLTSACCKVMERVVAAQLMDYLESNNILSAQQHGFRQNRCTEDQLLLTYNDVISWYDDDNIVDALLLDFSKAFDVVHHLILMHMLQALGVVGSLLEWINAFLSNRVMKVCVGESSSNEIAVTSGVPQGSVLGPLLFLVYVNHITQDIQCPYKAFADDYKLYLKTPRKGKSTAPSGLPGLQRALNRVEEVSSSWNLKLNPEKCVVMRFRRGATAGLPPPEYFLSGTRLKCVHAHKDLGVTVDSTLRFHDHVRVTVQKAGGLANNLLRSTVCRNADFMSSIFVSHVRPLIDYASCVWNTGYLGDSRLLEAVQRRFTKRIAGLEEVSYGDRLRELNLFSVKGRLLRADLIKYWKILHGPSEDMRALFQLAPVVGTRGHPLKLASPLCSTDARRRFFNVRCVRLWNELPSCVVLAENLTSFKRLLMDYLGERLFEYD